jgi:hypothetical protein
MKGNNMLNEPLIAKGERIYWKGDLICEMVMDVYPGDPMLLDQFKWYVEKPELHSPIHPAIMQYMYKRIQEVKNRKVKVESVQ